VLPAGVLLTGVAGAGGWAGAVVWGTASEITATTNTAIRTAFNREFLMNNSSSALMSLDLLV
jgi:hypothetical protein